MAEVVLTVETGGPEPLRFTGPRQMLVLRANELYEAGKVDGASVAQRFRHITLPLVAPLMERHGYKVPKAPRAPDREDAMRQYRLAAEFKRNRRDEGG